MSLEQKDIELIERIIYKNADDVAVSIARSFERLEERIDAAESRLYTRMADLEDRVEGCRQDIADQLSEVKSEVRESQRVRESVEVE
jgi:outer membrane protein TolC